MANEFKVRKGLIVQGSGSTLLDIQGSQGQLFSVTDSLTGSLFSVNDISGIPILEVFSDNRVLIGTFNAEAIKVSGSFANMTGSLLGTASVAATSVITTQDTTPVTYNVVFTGGTSGNHSLNVDQTTLTYNPSTTTLAVTNLAGTATTASNITPAIINDVDTRILTANGNGTLNGEANLTFNGSLLRLNGDAIVTGSLTTTGVIYAQPNGAMYFQGGDDVALHDINISNHMGIYGVQNSTVGAVKLGSSGPVLYGSGSNLGINTTAPSYPLHVSASVSNVSIYASNDIVAFSDQSVKENIRPIENVLERIGDSRGVLYDRIDNGEKDNIGFIAQELEVAFPELVVTNSDGTKAVKYQNAVAVLFEAIKEQQKQINSILKLLDK